MHRVQNPINKSAMAGNAVFGSKDIIWRDVKLKIVSFNSYCQDNEFDREFVHVDLFLKCLGLKIPIKQGMGNYFIIAWWEFSEACVKYYK